MTALGFAFVIALFLYSAVFGAFVQSQQPQATLAMVTTALVFDTIVAAFAFWLRIEMFNPRGR